MSVKATVDVAVAASVTVAVTVSVIAAPVSVEVAVTVAVAVAVSVTAPPVTAVAAELREESRGLYRQNSQQQQTSLLTTQWIMATNERAAQPSYHWLELLSQLLPASSHQMG